ncbi:MAG: glycosyltransferase family 4 protein [Terracidiphilus sp.]|jgi:glycosyltransferase involved in cell wall biosynthesis
MASTAFLDLDSVAQSPASRQQSILVGVTRHETCLVLRGRLRALRAAGFDVTVVSSPGVLLTRTAAFEGVRCVAIPISRGMAPVSDLISLVRLWLLIGRLRPDMVEFSTPKAGFLGTLAAWLRGVPRRVYMLRGLKLETTNGVKRRILLAAERLAARGAHVVLCNSRSLRAQALALGVGPASRMHLLGEGSSNGVDTDHFTPGPSKVRVRLRLPMGAKVVGFVGRLTRDKGVPELVDAFDQILEREPEAHLLLVGWYDNGEDELPASLRDRILAHPRIHLTGYVPDPLPYYRVMDVMALPTWREGFPNVVLEAAATGIPVVTTLSTGSRDSVVPEVTGLLIPPGYPEAITEAVSKLLADPERAQRMGRAARAWVMEHYIDEHVMHLTSSFYKSLLASPPGECPINDAAQSYAR